MHKVIIYHISYMFIIELMANKVNLSRKSQVSRQIQLFISG